jgi:hypothetical protein
MAYFQTQNLELVKIWRAFYDHLEHLLPFGIIYGRLVQFAVIWYIFPVLECLD